MAYERIVPLIVAAVCLLATAGGAADEHERKGPEVLQDVALGDLNMANPHLRARKFSMPAGYKSPSHRHDGPGIRYVLDGEITIYWKDGTKRTYGPGDTYFEGPGENHPPHDMSAANEGDTPVTVLIVDLHPGS
jgi:quercetin dioxygenase-like cupin family protein